MIGYQIFTLTFMQRLLLRSSRRSESIRVYFYIISSLQMLYYYLIALRISWSTLTNERAAPTPRDYFPPLSERCLITGPTGMMIGPVLWSAVWISSLSLVLVWRWQVSSRKRARVDLLLTWPMSVVVEVVQQLMAGLRLIRWSDCSHRPDVAVTLLLLLLLLHHATPRLISNHIHHQPCNSLRVRLLVPCLY